MCAKAFFVEGPTLLEVTRGNAYVNGGLYAKGERIIVHANRSYVVLCEEEECVRPLLQSGVFREAMEDERSVAEEWRRASYAIARECKGSEGCKVVALGSTESGKTSFCETVSNVLMTEGAKPCLVDADIGQSTIGFPGFVSAMAVSERLLWERRPRATHMFFVGSITPSGFEERVVRALSFLFHVLSEELKASYFVVDTDGWFSDERSIGYKFELLGAASPTHVVCLEERPGGLCEVIATLARRLPGPPKMLLLRPPPVRRERSRTDRKLIRGEKILLADMRRRCFNVFETPVVGSVNFGLGRPRPDYEDPLVGPDTVYVEEQPDTTLVVHRGRSPNGRRDRTLYVSLSFLEGLVVGLVDERNLHHFGMVEGLSGGGRLHVRTPYEGPVRYIISGRVKFEEGTFKALR